MLSLYSIVQLHQIKIFIPLLEDGLAHYGSQSQCSIWKESPKHPIPTGREDRRIILSQGTPSFRNKTGNDSPAIQRK